MKRLTKRIKKLDLFATLIDIAYVIFGIALITYFFIILVQPEVITDVVNTTYNIFGITLSSAQLNAGISLLVGYLVVFVPLSLSNLKRVNSKDIIEMDAWTYRTQFLYLFMSLFTFNPFSAVLRYLAGVEILKTVEGYGIKQATINIGHSIRDLFNGKALARARARKQKRLEETDSQRDLEQVGRRDVIIKVLGTVATYTFLTIIALFIFIPFYWMILTALKTNQELTTALNPRMFIGISEMQ